MTHKHDDNAMDEIFELEEELVEHLPVSEKKKQGILFSLDIVVNVLIIVLLVYVVRSFLISPFQVYGPSMCDTLNNIGETCQHGFGEYLIVNKAVYKNFGLFRYRLPKRGDIIVFRPPHNEDEFYIKRIIGEPGDVIEIKDGKVYLNEGEVSEPYLSDKNRGQTYLFSNIVQRFIVTPGHYFVLGDNRKESTDSRACFLPPLSQDCTENEDHLLPLESIEGKAMIVLWPINKVRLLDNPNYAVAAGSSTSER